MNAHEICTLICGAERKAAELILRARDIIAENKTSARDVVTEYDRRVQELLVGELRASVPDAHFFCEESDAPESVDSPRLFIIDPIDGTMNFVHGLHHSCISVAYAERGRVLAGAIYNPYLDELFHAVRGEGAFLNGRPIRVTDAPLSGSLVSFGTSPFRPELYDRGFAIARRLQDACLDLRRGGAAALDLCSVAAGRVGLFFEYNLSLWDYAAGALLVEEAGGVCRQPDGAPLLYTGEKGPVAAGAPAALEAFLALTKEL